MTKFNFRRVTIGVIFTWLIIFSILPNMGVLITSFLHEGNTTLVKLPVTLENYYQLFGGHFLRILLHSVYVASVTTLLCLVIAYPFSYMIARCQSRHKQLLLLFVILAFWTSGLIRT